MIARAVPDDVFNMLWRSSYFVYIHHYLTLKKIMLFNCGLQYYLTVKNELWLKNHVKEINIQHTLRELNIDNNGRRWESFIGQSSNWYSFAYLLYMWARLVASYCSSMLQVLYYSWTQQFSLGTNHKAALVCEPIFSCLSVQVQHSTQNTHKF